MDNFEKVRESFDDLEYMRHAQAMIVRDLIKKHDAQDILEIGFYKGKSSAYFAAILEDLGRGHLVTIDLRSARRRTPDIRRVLRKLELMHRVTPIYAHRSYTWELAKMIQAETGPRFDLCYFDGGHHWDGTGFGFVLVDILLRPGGWIVFDDIPWTMEAAAKKRKRMPKQYRRYGEIERNTPAVKLVFDLLVPRFGYTDLRIVNNGQWGIARKPLDDGGNRARSQGAISRFVNALLRR